MLSRRISAMTVMFATAVALSACSSGQPGDDEGSGPAEAAQTQQSSRVAPASCAELSLKSGTEISGGDLGQCLSGALELAGSLRATQYGEQGAQTGHSDIVLVPEIAVSATSDVNGRTSRAITIGGETWADLGEGWVHGDESSNDPQKMVVAQAGRAAVAMMSPEAITPAIATCATWRVDDQRVDVPSEGGTAYGAASIRCTGAMTLGGVQVTDAVLLFDDVWTPLGLEGVSSAAGVSAPYTVHYYDHGAQITIEPPTSATASVAGSALRP